jgi:hypothetical protein
MGFDPELLIQRINQRTQLGCLVCVWKLSKKLSDAVAHAEKNPSFFRSLISTGNQTRDPAPEAATKKPAFRRVKT